MMKGKRKEIRVVLRHPKSYATELPMSFLRGITRLMMTAALFFTLCFPSSFTQAATQILLEQGYEIRFDSGKFDTETFNMQITNLRVFRNDKRYWTADAILLETNLLPDGRTLIVKNMKIDSFVSSVDNLKIGSITVRNVTLDKYDHLFAGKFDSILDHALDNAYLGMFDFWAPFLRGAEYAAFVHSIELTPVRRTNTPSGSSYVNQIGLQGATSFKYRRLSKQNRVPRTDNTAMDELVAQLNLQNFEIVFDIENALIEDAGVMRVELIGNVDIKNHLSTDIEFDAEIPISVFWEIMPNKNLKNVVTSEHGDDFAQGLLANFLQSDAALTEVRLIVRDLGAFDRLLNLYAKNSGQTVTAATEEIRAKIDQGIKESISNQGLLLFPAIDEFLDYGGQLRLSVAPNAPVPFLSLATYLLRPEKVVKHLNVTIERLN